jgi:5'-nucleotidase
MRILQVSEGFNYAWDPTMPTGSKVPFGSIELDGTPIGLTTEYRVTVNSFLADGGDNFSTLILTPRRRQHMRAELAEHTRGAQ